MASRFPMLQLTIWGAGPTAVADPETAHTGVPVHEYSSVESQRKVTEFPDGARYEFWNATPVATDGPPFVTFVAYVTRLLLVVTPSYPSGSALTPTKLGTSEILAIRSTCAPVMVSEALLLSLLGSESEVVVATVAVLASTRGDGGEAIHEGRAVKVKVSTSFAASVPTVHEIRLVPALKLHVPLLEVRVPIV